MVIYCIVCLVLAVFLGGAYYAYRISFYAPMKGRGETKPITNPNYDPYRGEMRRIFQAIQKQPCEYVTIVSQDGLKLSGRYYHVQDGAPLDIGFHGYRSSPIVDFAGGFELSMEMGHNVLLVDQRAHGKSGGRTITFGIKERQDLLKWVEYAIDRFGKDVEILLYGISMGGATVLMAANLNLPNNVKGIIADCPYLNAMDIIRHVAKTMPIPQWLVKPFVILGARIFGGFDINEISATQALKDVSVPVMILHGDADSLVPCEMSDAAVKANPQMVTKHIFPGAEHGICYLVDTRKYHTLVKEFIRSVIK